MFQRIAPAEAQAALALVGINQDSPIILTAVAITLAIQSNAKLRLKVILDYVRLRVRELIWFGRGEIGVTIRTLGTLRIGRGFAFGARILRMSSLGK